MPETDKAPMTFEEWWSSDDAAKQCDLNPASQMHVIRIAFKAGRATMNEEAAQVAEGYANMLLPEEIRALLPDRGEDVTGHQSEMFEKPRQTRSHRAHWFDVGDGMKGYPYGAKFRCVRCKWQSKWLCFDNKSEIRRGVACPNCNPDRKPE